MKMQVARNDACEATVTVEVDQETVQLAMQKAARRIAEKGNIPGFRKGKAPYGRVVNAYGEDAVLDEALDALGPEIYRKAIDEEKLEPSAVGTMTKIVSRTPLVLEFLVPLKPEVEMGDYRSIHLPFEEPVIPPEEVERTLEQLRQSQSVLEPVQRAAQKGDVVVGNAKTEALLEGGKSEPIVFEGEENPVELDLDENLGGRFPGAGAAFEGINEGESRSVEFQYPDTYPIERLRNLRARLSFECLGVKIRKLPEWDENLVKAVSESTSLEELRTDIQTRLANRAREEKEEEYADQVIDKMMEGAKVRYPAALLEEELDDEVQALERRLERRKMSLEVYLRTIQDGLAGLRKQMEPDVRKKLARRLFLAEMVKQEGLEPSDEDTEQQAKVYRQAFAESRPAKGKEAASFENTLRNLAANDVLARMIVQQVVRIGRGQPLDQPKAPAAKEA